MSLNSEEAAVQPLSPHGVAAAHLRLITARQALRLVPLAAALVAAVVMYLPAIRSPFLGDDYLLLLSSRDMSIAGFLKSATIPWANPGTLELSDHYWRPLSYLTFRAIYAVFGAQPLPYHLFSLAVHCASVVLIYVLAWRLLRSWGGAAVAAALMAVNPAGFESVTWIAALNSAALPLALGAWLAYMNAAGPNGELRWRWLTAALALQALAFAYRETAVVVVAAMVIWFLLVPARQRLRSKSTWIIAGAPVALAAIHALALSEVFSSDGGRSLISIDLDSFRTGWFYLKQVLPVTHGDSSEGLVPLQPVAGALALALPVVALATRRWTLAALSLAFLVSIVPYAAFSLGSGARYFYFPGAILALVAGDITAGAAGQLSARLERRSLDVVSGVAGIALVGCLAIGAVYGSRRVHRWVVAVPDANERFVQQLKTENPTLPAGGGVYIVDAPYPLPLVQGYILAPILEYEYPGEHHPAYSIDAEHVDFARSIMGPDDRLFFYRP